MTPTERAHVMASQLWPGIDMTPLTSFACFQILVEQARQIASEEREACARVAECLDTTGNDCWVPATELIAEAIRKRPTSNVQP